MLRGLNGSLQWPAAQTMVCLAASVSFSQSAASQPTIGDLLEANKTLRFAKANGDVGLRYKKTCELTDLRIGIYFDASWASRPTGESQGGYLIFCIDQERHDAGTATHLNILDWSSKKLTRVARSSLAAETHGARYQQQQQ